MFHGCARSNTSTRSMSDKSDSVLIKFQPRFINMFLTSIPMLIPISRYNLPYGFNQCMAFFAIDSYAARPLFFAYNAMRGSCVAAWFTRASPHAI